MLRPFIWQFNLDTQVTPCWMQPEAQALAAQPDRLAGHYEQRFFWGEHESIQLKGFELASLWLSRYEFETRQDSYVMLESKENIKLRKKKLHIKPKLYCSEQVNFYGDKQKFHLIKQASEVSKRLALPQLLHLQDIEQIKQEMRQHLVIKDVYKESLLLSFAPHLPMSIEFSRLKIDNNISHSFVIEANTKELVIYLRQQMALPLSHTRDYVAFLEEGGGC